MNSNLRQKVEKQFRKDFGWNDVLLDSIIAGLDQIHQSVQSRHLKQKLNHIQEHLLDFIEKYEEIEIKDRLSKERGQMHTYDEAFRTYKSPNDDGRMWNHYYSGQNDTGRKGV